MSKPQFFSLLQQELNRVDTASITKRKERIIEGFTNDHAPRAVVGGKEYQIFNSNDYLGLRFHPTLRAAEKAATDQFGTGPGAVRFISGTLQVHRNLEKAVAAFHGRDDGMVFSSAFAANLAVMFCLIKGQSADSVVDGNVLVVSDALNHRSIIDGIRLPNLAKEQKQIFKHLDTTDLDRILQENIGKWSRILVVTDGVFSMLGEYQDLSKLRAVIDKYDDQYPNGVLLVVDDCHGIAACGQTGRGVEEIFGAKADVLVGTFGKGFGADGGYVVANQTIIDYLRESAATYIYSNSISPGTAGAALAAVQLLDDADGQKLLAQSRANVAQFKQAIQEAGFSFAAQSSHPIQPLLIGDAAKARALTEGLFAAGFIVTNLSYPVVTKGRDEIRVQISAAQEATDITAFVAAAAKVGREVGII